MNVSHVREISHSRRNAPQHSDKLQWSELLIICFQKRFQSSVLHVLHHNHVRGGLCDNALQVNHVGVVELAHDAGFGKEIESVFLGCARFEGFYCDWDVITTC